jgi:hypothetical protein
MKVFGKTLRSVATSAQPAVFGPRAAALSPAVAPLPSTSPANHIDTSQNWSGGYLMPDGGRSFVQIWGQWTVPVPSPPAHASPPQHGTLEYQCSVWIGLDGNRRYRNSSLPQIGTTQSVTVAPDGSCTFKTVAWTQWWNRGGTSEPVTIPDFPVAHGDVISCVLTVLDEHRVLLNMVNQSTSPPAFAALELDAPFDRTPSGSLLQLSVSGATAEWILERPTILGQTGMYAFPDYGSMNFVECYAVEASAGGTDTAVMKLLNPRFIRMFEICPGSQSTAYISMPARIDETSFNLRYGDVWP